VNTWHNPACAPQNPSTLARCTNSAHPYQNKGFANQNSEFLTSLFSHTCAHSRLQPLCFDILHKNTQGERVPPVTTVPSQIGIGAPALKRAERFLSRLCGIGMTEGEGAMVADGAGGITEGRKGKRNPRTGLKAGHYIRIESGPAGGARLRLLRARYPCVHLLPIKGSCVNAILARSPGRKTLCASRPAGETLCSTHDLLHGGE
jgi:hypothetical protein